VSDLVSGLVAPPDIAELIRLSNRYGADPLFVRAGGGNSSVKAGGVLWIKPSGVPLATLAADDLVPLDRARLLALLDLDPATLPVDRDPVMATAAEARLAEAHGRRPSVELLFHALLPERLVLHTHPIHANAVTCNRDGPALAERLFGSRAVWVPYTDPGLPLAHAILAARAAYEARTRCPAPPITLLGNHGIIVGGESAAAIEAETAWLVGAIEAELDRRPTVALPPAAAQDARVVDAIAAGLDRPAFVFDPHPLAASFAGTAAGRAFMDGGPLIPDQIVYTGSWPMVLDIGDAGAGDAGADGLADLTRRAVDAFEASRGVAPIVTVVPGLGLFATGDRPAQAETARDIYLDMLRVAEGADRLGGVRHLNDAERRFIEDWEAEAYRRQIAAGS
jgi:rhamnose utilization protein RhaD (predicted bifunctional aldolase and dehydrogenase)